MANKYAITGGGNWTGSTWNTASNQATSNTTAPTTSDVAILDAYSGNVVVDATTCVCSSLNCTGYTGTLSGSSPNQLWSYGSWTLSSGMTLSGDWIFKCGNSSTTGTWTPASQTFPGDFIANGTGAKTMSGSGFTVTGLMTWLQTCNLTGSGLNIDVLGGWTGTSYFNDSTSTPSTNPTVTIRGGVLTGTLPNSSAGCILEPSVSDITFEAGIPYKTQIRETAYLIANTSTYSIIHGANTQTYFIVMNGTLKTANMTWNSIYWASGSPTLEEDFYINELGTNNNTSGGFNGSGKVVHISGDWPMRATCTIGGTATYRMEGTGTFGVPTLNGSTLSSAITFNGNLEFASGSTVTIYGKAFTFGGGGSITDNDGGVTIQSGFLPSISGTFTWNFDATVTSLSFLTNTDVFNQISDLDMGTLNMYAGSTIHGANTKTLTVTTAVNAGGNEQGSNVIDAISGTFNIDYQGTVANQFFAKTDFEDVIATGLRINTWHGNVTNCTNVYAVTGDDIGGGGGAGVSVTNY